MLYGTGPFLYPTSILLIKRQVPVVEAAEADKIFVSQRDLIQL
jgi:hypothetical protein